MRRFDLGQLLLDCTTDGQEMRPHRRRRVLAVAGADRVDEGAVFEQGQLRPPLLGQRQTPHAVERCARRLEKSQRTWLGDRTEDRRMQRFVEFVELREIAGAEGSRLLRDVVVEIADNRGIGQPRELAHGLNL